MSIDRLSHWDAVYTSKAPNEVSWFQDSPSPSIEIILSLARSKSESVIDIGGGASRLAEALLREGFDKVSVLDLSESALTQAKARLGSRSNKINWIVADVTQWKPREIYDLWHDRAAFHFLTEPADQKAYAECVSRAIRPGGHVVIGTFAPDGPERCSGLPVQRHDSSSIGAILGQGFELVGRRDHDHLTPAGKLQRFQFSSFRRAF